MQKHPIYLVAAFLALAVLAHPLQARAGECPATAMVLAGTATPFACDCPASALATSDFVWGTDIYAGNSSVCRAARHASVIGPQGGAVTMVPEAARNSYAGSARNGIESGSTGAFRMSFRFAQTASAPTAVSTNAAPPAASPAAITDCPDNFTAYKGTTAPLTCTCSPEAAGRNSQMNQIWGTDVYSSGSDVCVAARHAGIVPRATGGIVTVIPGPGQQVYPGSTRNGAQSFNSEATDASFRFGATGGGTAPTSNAAVSPAVQTVPAAPAPAPSAASPAAITDCPDNFTAYKGTTAPLTCTCSPEAAGRNSQMNQIWGTDVYSSGSDVCVAARHAGIVPRATGGIVTVIPGPGQQVYPGSTRNGAQSFNSEATDASFRFGPPASGSADRGASNSTGPVQQPIAASLRERGEVDLYVRFRTASAELDPTTIPVLDELRGALAGAPGLNLALTGHTDTVGTREYNLSLSLRRAEAVRFWLADHGIGLSRITVDGRGFDQPIADNATDSGRAFNRRVQAKRLP